MAIQEKVNKVKGGDANKKTEGGGHSSEQSSSQGEVEASASDGDEDEGIEGSKD